MQVVAPLPEAPTAEALRHQFLLDPDVIFLNHGSFGACPRPVFAQYQAWQRELERQPVDFLQRRATPLLDAARARIAANVNTDPDHLTFVTNTTAGLNVIARSLPLRPGDEVLTTDLEYGALNFTWEHLCAKAGARYVRQPMTLPLQSSDQVIEELWQGVTPRTRAIFLSHITSITALTLPVAAICERARAAGILTIIDGAHVPGQLPLDIPAVGADIYAGNCHKWLCAPKGSAFLYVRPEQHAWVESLVISWGWQDDHTFVTRNQRQGTRDLGCFLATPAAIDFQALNGWDAVRERCHHLATEVRDRLCDLFGLEPLSSDGERWFEQMVAVPLPPVNAGRLQGRLLDRYNIEVPITEHDGRQFVRVSVQGYTADGDLDALVDALRNEI